MLFNSFPFLLLFLPIVLLLSLRLRGQGLLRFLSLASFVFYAFAGHAWFIIPMLVTTCLDFYMAPLIASAAQPVKKKAFLMVSLVGNLGLLCYFKYSNLILSTGASVTSYWAEIMGWHNTSFQFQAFAVILPAGISFYTFQTLAYIIDVYRGNAHPERNFWRFACFVSFFPHLVAGPLTRHDQLIPQLTTIAKEGVIPRWEQGVYLFAIGLCKKVLLGDRIDVLVYPLVQSPDSMTMTSAWLALIGFTLQIYFDFSGYSDMAIGLGRLFGIELPQNFNSPYKSLNPSEFWRRWHMTLSLWLRDYLYISLGGNRCSNVRRNINIMLTMVIGGLWHGASLMFALWGAYHGLLLVIFHRAEGVWNKMPVALQRGLTFILVMIGWLFFKATTWAVAKAWLSHLIDFQTLQWVSSGVEIKLALISLFGLVVVQCLPNASSHPDLSTIKPRYKMLLGLTTLVSLVMLSFTSRFLYFQF